MTDPLARIRAQYRYNRIDLFCVRFAAHLRADFGERNGELVSHVAHCIAGQIGHEFDVESRHEPEHCCCKPSQLSF